MKPESVQKRKRIKATLLVMLLCLASSVCIAQTPTDSLPVDPAEITVYTVQNMSFGAFSHSNLGGNVFISTNGTRTVTGDIILLNFGVSYFQAIFDLDAPKGSIISILNGPDATLNGSNGGSMSIHLGNSFPASPFSTVVSQPQRTQVNIGGRLTVGNSSASPSGTYTGYFYITFNHE